MKSINSENIRKKLDDFFQSLKMLLHLFDNEKIKNNFLHALPFWVGAFISGAVAVLYAKLFYWMELASHLLFEKIDWLFLILTPVCFVLAWWIVIKYSPFSRGSGIPQVSAAIQLSTPKNYPKVNSLLSLKVILAKITSSLVMAFGGGAIGREGPTIQISASILKKINDLLPESYPKISNRTMIVTGAAAGLAAAFNTPLGGIVFAIEELTKTHFSLFKSALLTGVIIAGLTALNFLGPYLYLGYPHLDGISFWIILSIIPLAVITGLIGGGMGKAILRIFKQKKSLKNNSQKLVYVAICGLILASMAIFIDSTTFGSGKDIMVKTLFSDQKNLGWYVPILRIFGPIISYSTGASCGLFAPSLGAGATIGAVFSEFLHLSNEETNLIILCGMAGCLTGITRSPFTASILVLEMTNSHDVIFYIMFAALLSNLMASLVSNLSFYDEIKEQLIDEITHSEPAPTAISAASP